MATHASIVREIRRWCKRRGYYYRKIHGGGYQHRGLPDLYILAEGQTVWLEVKAGRDEPSASQREEIRAIRRAGGRAEVVRSAAEARAAILRAIGGTARAPGGTVRRRAPRRASAASPM